MYVQVLGSLAIKRDGVRMENNETNAPGPAGDNNGECETRRNEEFKNLSKAGGHVYREQLISWRP